MTSSLVGSEMCIRDSTRPKFNRVPAAQPGTAPAAQPGEVAHPHFFHCLLYTSDAADECRS
eukprot:3041526-Prorocentrum_lima.AAC.1